METPSPTLQATLAFLDDYETPGEALSLTSDAQEQQEVDRNRKSEPADVCTRFKRARLRRKQEIEDFRAQVDVLKERLAVLQTQQKSDQLQSLRALARRKKTELEDAESLNRRLERLVDTAQRLTRNLEDRLRQQPMFKTMFSRKQVRAFTNGNPLTDAVALHDQMERVDEVQAGISDVYARFGIRPMETAYAEVKTERFSSCGASVEAIDCRVLLFDLESVSDAVWHVLTREEGPIVAQPMAKGGNTARMYCADLSLGGFESTFRAYDVLRRVSMGSGRVLIVWASAWHKEFDAADTDARHRVLHREGFVNLRRTCSGDVIVHTLNRLRLDSCQDPHCAKNPSVDSLAISSGACVQDEAAQWLDVVELRLLCESTAKPMLQPLTATSCA